MRQWLCIAFCLNVLLSNGCGKAERETVSLKEVTLVTEDGIGFPVYVIKADANTEASRGIVLLMDKQEGSGDWLGFAQEGYSRGYNLIAFHSPVNSEVNKAGNSEFINAAIAELESKSAAIAVITSGEAGCNALIQPPKDLPWVLISPSKDCTDAAKALEAPLLVIAAEGDEESATAAVEISEGEGWYREVKLFPGDASGAMLCVGSARRQLFKWLDEVMLHR